MPERTMWTPWGYPQDVKELAEGVWEVSTASHGGLALDEERWKSLPPEVMGTLINPAFAEEDCESPIVKTILGLANQQEREWAIRVAEEYPRYAPTLPYLKNPAPTKDHNVTYFTPYR